MPVLATTDLCTFATWCKGYFLAVCIVVACRLIFGQCVYFVLYSLGNAKVTSSVSAASEIFLSVFKLGLNATVNYRVAWG